MAEMHSEAFREEAYELLADLEASLLELEENPGDADLIGRAFRAMHTIKGSGAMFGFTDISELTHEVETVFDQIRNGTAHVSKILIDKTLKAGDLIRSMLSGEGQVDHGERQELIACFRHMAVPIHREQAEDITEISSSIIKENSDEEKLYRIRFKPSPNIFLTGANPLFLLKELRELGTCRIIAHLSDIPTFDIMDPERCYTYWDIILSTSKGVNGIKDVFIFVEDDCQLSIDVIDDSGSTIDKPTCKRLGEILVERGDLTPEDMEIVLKNKKRFGEMLVESGLAVPSKVEAALVEQQQIREAQQKRQNSESAASIRVPSDKLDTLVNLVGELVTVQARLSQTASLRGDQHLAHIAEEVERLTSELRDSTLNIRMMPIGATFSKFRRLVRDLSQQLGKEVEILTEGANTELDKTVIERLNDPLVHIIRNSIDHGIESPDCRVAAGKPRHGTVHLTAEHSGDSVIISIMDDGAGLDTEAIRTKAIERKLITETAELSDRELFALIFAPGFSTAEKITGISGRGVGMDVVKQSIEALRGFIEITSQKGKGTKITIKLPLTLAIIESLMVKIGEEFFVMPLSLVEECVELTLADIEMAHGRNLANVRGILIPYIPLRERFRLGDKKLDIQHVVVTEIAGERIGLLVDSVIGEHQTVIKSLGKMYRDAQGVSGATILGDGSVALILDVPQLVQWA
ncbi:MAG: chemotaxis protein CheA [Geobacteraceae bacterium]|nr:chemotaxis protein CheA [Geobacteraceae bacterium]